MIIKEFFINLCIFAFMLSVGGVIRVFFIKRGMTLSKLQLGVFAGLVSITLMNFPVRLEGFLYDLRYPILIFSFLYLGRWPGMVSGLIILVARVFLGGSYQIAISILALTMMIFYVIEKYWNAGPKWRVPMYYILGYLVAYSPFIPQMSNTTMNMTFHLQYFLFLIVGTYLGLMLIEAQNSMHQMTTRLSALNEKLQDSQTQTESKNHQLANLYEEQQQLNEEMQASQDHILEINTKLNEKVQEADTEKNRLQAVLDTIEEGVIVTGLDGEIIYQNSKASNLLVMEDHLNSDLLEDPEQIKQNPFAVTKQTYDLIESKDLVIDRYTAPVVDKKGGSIIGRVLVYRDLTQQFQIDKERTRFTEIESTLAEFAYNTTLILDVNEVLLATEKVIKRLIPVDFAAILLINDNRTPMDTVRSWCNSNKCSGNPVKGLTEVSYRCKALLAGQIYKVYPDSSNIECSCYPVDQPRCAYSCIPLTAMGKTFGVIHVGMYQGNQPFDKRIDDVLRKIATLTAMTISNLRLIEETKAQAITDQLTGIYNKRYLDDFLERELLSSAHSPTSLLVIDIDRFKSVNDTYGHAVGDQVLMELASRVKYLIRNSDVFGRYGGEEFLVILPDTKYTSALTVAEKIRADIENHVMNTHAGELKITISIGVATCPDHARERLDLFKAADKGLYHSKNQGRNRVSGIEEVI